MDSSDTAWLAPHRAILPMNRNSLSLRWGLITAAATVLALAGVAVTTGTRPPDAAFQRFHAAVRRKDFKTAERMIHPKWSEPEYEIWWELLHKYLDDEIEALRQYETHRSSGYIRYDFPGPYANDMSVTARHQTVSIGSSLWLWIPPESELPPLPETSRKRKDVAEPFTPIP